MSYSYAYLFFSFFFFNDTATTEIYTLSLHDALPIRPVMPTSYGLSHSTCSLPRSACTMGDFSLAPSANSASCAPAQPEPHNRVTRDDVFKRLASRSSSPSAGRTSDGPGNRLSILGAGASTASLRAVSPEITITATPRWPTAARIAISSARGICSGEETNSQ